MKTTEEVHFSSTTNFELTLVVRFKVATWYTLEVIATPGRGLSIDLAPSADYGLTQRGKSDG